MTPTRSGRLATGALMFAAACGTGGSGVELSEPTPTVFADEAVEAGDSAPSVDAGDGTTTTAPIAGRLPQPRIGGLGVVEIDGMTLAVTAATTDGWAVLSPCGAQVEIGDVVPRSNVLVVLDPGHGGDDRGATSDASTADEADLNLSVALAASADLEDRGVPVILTRTDDVTLPGTARSAVVGPSGALVFVSIHHRGDEGEPVVEPHTEVFHQVGSDSSRRLAGLVHEELTAALTVAGVDWTATAQPGVKHLLNQRGSDYFTVLRETPDAASVLVEVASLASPSGAALLDSDEGRQREARALSEAIVRFLVTADAGNGYVEPAEQVREAPTGGGESECIDPIAPPPD